MSRKTKKSKRKSKRGPGRPKGAKNIQADTIVVPPTRCKCGSTRKKALPNNGPLTQEYSGIAPDGQPYTHIVRTRYICLDCGQHRIEKTYEFRPKTTRKTA